MKKNEKKKYYCDGSVTKFVYSATGEKLRVVYQTTDPNIIVPVGSNVAFSKEFANNIQNVFSDNNRLPIRVQLQFVIDKKGHLIGARIFGKESDELSDFEKAVLKALCFTKDWQAGRQNGTPVNVLLTMPINICPND